MVRHETGVGMIGGWDTKGFDNTTGDLRHGWLCNHRLYTAEFIVVHAML